MPLHEVRANHSSADPPPHVSEKPWRDWSWGLPLVGRAAADREAVINALLKVDERPPHVAVR
jgi:hypothetical protein